MEGRDPQQIANQPKADKVLTPTAYKAQQEIKYPNKKPENPYGWKGSSVVNIRERQEYTGCAVNFMTYTNSIRGQEAAGKSYRKNRHLARHARTHYCQ